MLSPRTPTRQVTGTSAKAVFKSALEGRTRDASDTWMDDCHPFANTIKTANERQYKFNGLGACNVLRTT